MVLMAAEHCLGHLNGFDHLTEDLEGLEQTFDVGYKFVVEEPIGHTGGPYLSLYISVTPLATKLQLEGAAPFTMGRDEWEESHGPGELEHLVLMQRSLPVLVERLRRG